MKFYSEKRTNFIDKIYLKSLNCLKQKSSKRSLKGFWYQSYTIEISKYIKVDFFKDELI